jgi:PPOX class probable F420-dependent enzyme
MTDAQAGGPSALFGTGRRGLLVTIKRDGRPQLSIVGYLFDKEGESVVISVTDDRAKTRNIRRDPRVSFQVSTPDLGAYAVGEGIAELSAVAARTDDAVVDGLVAHYRALNGDHPDWADFRAAMVRERRLLLRIPFTHIYGWLPTG